MRINAFVIVLLSAIVFGCSPRTNQDMPKTEENQVQVSAETSQAADNTAGNSEDVAKHEVQQPVHGHVHDPANPPVDCPLRKQGIDPTQMKPFEQMEAYIQFLDREDRAIWQKPSEVVEQMHLNGNERVLDLGAGSGYFSFPIASKLPAGRLFAADVEPEMIRHIHHKAMLNGIQNIEVRLIDAKAPEIPENIDIVFMCDVMHHIANPVEWMAGIVRQLPQNAQFHIIEFKKGEIPNGPPENAKIDPDKLKSIALEAGLELTQDDQGLLPYQNYFVFKKK